LIADGPEVRDASGEFFDFDLYHRADEVTQLDVAYRFAKKQ
jgi:hypothetical protein